MDGKCGFAWLAVVLAWGQWAVADELAAAARQVSAQHAPSVIMLRLTLKEAFSGPDYGTSEDEYMVEVPGTVVNPDGTTVMSLASSDPYGMYMDFAEELGRASEGYKFDMQITTVRMLLGDGRELPATVVLRDRDLDLAVVRPKEKPGEPLPFVDLTKSVGAQVFDPVVVLGRMGAVGNRGPMGTLDRICAVVSKPRTLYVMYNGPIGLGCPAFTPESAPVGVITFRTTKSRPDDLAESMDDWGQAVAVILPGKDVLEVTAQAEGLTEPAADDAGADGTANQPAGGPNGESKTE